MTTSREENRDADSRDQPIPLWNQEHGQLDLPERRRPANPSHRETATGRNANDRSTTANGADDEQHNRTNNRGASARNAVGPPTPAPAEANLTEQEREWLAALQAVEADDIAGISDISRQRTAAAATRIEQHQNRRTANNDTRHNNQRAYQRRPPPARPVYDAAAASTLQKLYRIDRKKAINQILGGARYSGLKRVDPGSHVMEAIFNYCLRQARVPKEWKETTKTILIHKSGVRDDLNNWRPLSLGNTIGKLYSAILADRIAFWAKDGGRLSVHQKGFTSHDGFREHNFIVQTAIDDARRTEKAVPRLAGPGQRLPLGTSHPHLWSPGNDGNAGSSAEHHQRPLYGLHNTHHDQSWPTGSYPRHR